jgi:hypothetical protein
MYCQIFCLMGPNHVAWEGEHRNANKLAVITHNGGVTTLSYLKKCTRGGKDVFFSYTSMGLRNPRHRVKVTCSFICAFSSKTMHC